MAAATIQCPSCGSTNPEDFQVLDELTVGWQALTVEENLLVCDGLYTDYEMVNHERLYCNADIGPVKMIGTLATHDTCGTEFPIPDGVKVDYR